MSQKTIETCIRAGFFIFKLKMKHIYSLFTTAFVAIALTPSLVYGQNLQRYSANQLFETAMNKGQSDGVLVGEQADFLKSATHSKDDTIARIVRGDATADGCQIFHMTLTQPNVPTTSGMNAGDYVATTKITKCRDDRQPTTEVTACVVGKISCMPAR